MPSRGSSHNKHPGLLLLGNLSCLVAIVIVALAGQSTAAVSIGAVWAATCGALSWRHNSGSPDPPSR